MRALAGHFAELSTQKFSSNVVERCLKLGGLDALRQGVVRELVDSPLLPRLLQDRCAFMRVCGGGGVCPQGVVGVHLFDVPASLHAQAARERNSQKALGRNRKEPALTQRRPAPRTTRNPPPPPQLRQLCRPVSAHD